MNKREFKVLFVQEPYDNISGQELSLYDRLIGLRELGVQVAVLLPGKGRFSALLESQGFTVKCFTLRRLHKKNPLPFLKTVFQVWKIIKREGFSVVHCSGVYPGQYSLPAARLARIPCIIHVNAAGVYSKHALSVNFVKYADLVIGVSEAVRQEIREILAMPEDKAVTVHDGIQESEKKIEGVDHELRDRYGIKPGEQIVGQISAIIPRKRLEDFVAMARIVKNECPGTKFMIVGEFYEQGYMDFLKGQIKDLALTDDIIFTGFQQDVYRFMNLLDVNVLASEAEGLGRVIVQAQMIGKPVVATAVGGAVETIVDQKTGLLVPPRNPAALAAAVLDFLRNPDKAKECGEDGRWSALAIFSIEAHAKALMQIYERLLMKRGTCANRN